MTEYRTSDCEKDEKNDTDIFLNNDRPSQTMFFWADQLLVLKDELEAVKMEEKRLQEKYDQSERRLFDMMESAEIDQFKRNGFSFSPRVATHASIKSEYKKEAMEWLKQSDYSDIVKETVNAQTLTSMIKEWNDNGMQADIEVFMEFISVHHKQKISILRSR